MMATAECLSHACSYACNEMEGRNLDEGNSNGKITFYFRFYNAVVC